MSVIAWVTTITVIVLCGAILLPVSRKIRVPRDGLLLILGFVASEVFTAQGYDTGLRWYHFKDIVLFGVLPLLVFNTALHVDIAHAKQELFSVLLLAFPIRLVIVSLIGLMMFYGISYPTGFPLAVAFLLAVMLTAPDPDSLIEHANLWESYPRASLIVRAESVLGDVLAIVLFSFLLNILLMASSPPTGYEIALQFVWVLFGGVLLGFISGKFSEWLLNTMPTDPTKVIFLIGAAYLNFILAEKLLMVSGVVTILVLGVTLSRSCSEIMEGSVNVFAEILTIGLFFVAGITLTTAMFKDRWVVMLLAGFALILARSVGIYLHILAIKFLKPVECRPTKKENCLMLMSGVPGTVALALALSLPLDVTGWYTVQAAVYGVVIVGMIIQTPVLIAVFNRLRAS